MTTRYTELDLGLGLAGRIGCGCGCGEGCDEYSSLYAGCSSHPTDCALVTLAGQRRTTRVLSFDERRFRAVAPLHGRAFTLRPADA